MSPNHPLTHTSPTPTPTRASFHRKTACAQPIMSPSHSVRVAEEMALSDSALHKRHRISYETSSSSFKEDDIGEEDTDDDEGHGLDDEGHGLDDEGHGLDDEGHGLDDEGHGLYDEGCSVENDGISLEGEEERRTEGQHGSSELGGNHECAFRTWVWGVEAPRLSSRRGLAYIDIPAYPPPAPPAKTLPSPEWSSGSLPVSPAPFAVPSPILSPMISLTVPSLIASLVTALTATILACDTTEGNMSRAGYDDLRLVHDMLVQQAALQHELQEMRGRVTALEQERDRMEQ
ncbi:hypothetical protein Tco_0057913 [Tanacetum coccineum]